MSAERRSTERTGRKFARAISVSLLFLWSAGSPAAAPDLDPVRQTLELRTARRAIPHSRPWQITNVERSLRPAVPLGDGVFLSFEPAMADAIGSTLRFPGDLEISAQLVHRDALLGLSLVRIDRQGDEARGWRPPPRVRFADSLDLRARGQALQLVGYGSRSDRRGLRGQTVFLEGMRAGSLPVEFSRAGRQARALPLMQFSGGASGIHPGDLLFAKRGSRWSLAGIVVRFDAKERIGQALPAPLISGYIQLALKAATAREKRIAAGKNGPAASADDVSGPSSSVISDPGFRTRPIASQSARAYYGLRPGEEGALLVTRVLPELHALRDRVRPGDVILGANGQKLGPGGTLLDARYGPLPLTALLGFRKGRPLPAPIEIRLDIARERERRTVSIQLQPQSLEYLRVPAYFERPAYLIAGGLVLVELSERYLNERVPAQSDPAAAPRLRFLADPRRLPANRDQSRFVVLDRILPVLFNEAYRATIAGRPLLLLSLNGVAVRSLSHLHGMMAEHLSAGRDLAFAFEGGRLLVLPGQDQGAALKAADATVRARHGIPYLQANLDSPPNSR